MEYFIGLLLSLGVAALAAIMGFDRERVFYATVLIVIASYYVLFAVMGATQHTLFVDILVAGAFLLAAVLGFKTNMWLIAAALVGHGIFDFIRPAFIVNPGVPTWWPGFCLVFDVVIGGWLALRLIRHDAAAAARK